MFLEFLYPLVPHFGFLNLLRYLTFRTGCALMTAFLISFWLGPYVISYLKSIQKGGQPIRKDGPESHLLTKQGTPTMGGILILIALVISVLLWGNLHNSYVWITLGVTFAYGLIGLYDDLLKLTKRTSKGLSARSKLVLQMTIAGVCAYLVQCVDQHGFSTTLTFPFLKSAAMDIGILYLPFAILVIVGASNAVNLTDGLDGLAIFPVMIVAGCFCLIVYLVGNHVYAHYLQLQYVPGSGELAIIGGSLIGAGLGFLWYNAPPAMVFMGDTGSLAVGGALGIMSVITKHEFVLFIMGGLFVMETFSVMLQVAYFRWSGGKRIFLMAPIHHHFEKKGWKETTIVIRFWIISVLFALIGLSALKIR